MLKSFFIFLMTFSLLGFAQEGEGDFIEMDQKDLEELEALKKTQQAQYQNISDPIAEPLNKLFELTSGNISLKSLLDTKVLAALKDVVEKGGLDRINPNDLKDNMSKSALGPLVDKFPTVFYAFTNVLKDKKSVTHLLNIIEEKDHAKNYAIAVIILFVLFIFLKTKLVKPKWGFFKRFIWNTTFNISYLIFSIGFFYYWFYNNLSPAVSVFIRSI